MTLHLLHSRSVCLCPWQTPLIESAFRGFEEIVRLLLRAGANISAKDNDGQV